VRAAIGVSYASPAYYADRLVDRGRAYIRDFIVGTKERRQELNDAKKQWASGFAKLREHLFGDKKEAGESVGGTTAGKAKWGKGRQRMKKNEDEEYYDVVEREMTDEKASKWVMARIQETWGSLDRNPWHARMDDSMFWM
jgi:eukaryotic translation initiation factor 2C